MGREDPTWKTAAGINEGFWDEPGWTHLECEGGIKALQELSWKLQVVCPGKMGMGKAGGIQTWNSLGKKKKPGANKGWMEEMWDQRELSWIGGKRSCSWDFWESQPWISFPPDPGDDSLLQILPSQSGNIRDAPGAERGHPFLQENQDGSKTLPKFPNPQRGAARAPKTGNGAGMDGDEF